MKRVPFYQYRNKGNEIVLNENIHRLGGLEGGGTPLHANTMGTAPPPSLIHIPEIVGEKENTQGTHNYLCPQG